MNAPDTTILRHKDAGPLHDLLIRACPPNRKGQKSIPVLAKAMELTKWNIYKWIKRGRVPPERAEEIVKLANGSVALEEFFPFIFRSAA